MSIEGLPEKQLANTRTQRDINAIIEYLRTLADSAGGSAHIIAKESLQYAQRSILDFSGEGVQVLDYPGSDTTRVLIGGSSGSAGDAGADIRIIGNTIQRAGNGVLLYDAGGDPVREYAFTEAGVAEAFAAAAAGDVVDLPAGTLTGDVTVPAGVTLRGMGEATVIDGAVVLGEGARLIDVTASLTDTDSDDLIVVQGGNGAVCVHVTVIGEQSGTGAIIGIVSTADSADTPMRCYDCPLSVENKGTGSAWWTGEVVAGGLQMHQGSVAAVIA